MNIDDQIKEAAANINKAETNLEQAGLQMNEAWSEYHNAVAVHGNLKRQQINESYEKQFIPARAIS